MSAVRYHDGIPHIIRGGMHDEKKEVCWIWFFRCGLRFGIDVIGEEVKGTTFYEKWKPLIKEHARGEQPLSQWVDKQWHRLCDLIISASIETLRELAPEKEYWTTLADYLQCPTYRFKLKATHGKDAVEVEMSEGPKLTGAYQMEPLPFEEYQPLSNDLPRVRSSDLEVLNKEKDWRQPPHKVRAPDGKVYYFKACEHSSMALPERKMRNPSLDAIVAHLSVYELMLAGGAEPPEGILTFKALVTCKCVNASDPSSAGSIEDEQDGIAGILLPWVSKGKTLSELCRDADEAGKSRVSQARAGWKAQVKVAVQALHERALYIGGRPDWAYLNQHTIMVDTQGQLWLTGTAVSADDPDGEKAKQSYKMDEEAIEKVFEDWLPAQLS